MPERLFTPGGSGAQRSDRRGLANGGEPIEHACPENAPSGAIQKTCRMARGFVLRHFRGGPAYFLTPRL